MKTVLSLVSIALLGWLSACVPAVDESFVAVTNQSNNCVAFDRSASEELKNYFAEVSLGSEFGGNQRIHKWQEPLRVSVAGRVTESDRTELISIISELNDLVGVKLIRLVEDNENVRIFFDTTSRFKSYLPEYIEGNEGFFWFYWNAQGHLYDATVLINKDQEEIIRKHLLREELTQVLGLATDSQRYPRSIFYQPWTNTTSYSLEDKAIIKMLYSCEVKSNMTLEQVRTLF